MRTAVGQTPGPRGRTIELRVSGPEDLKRQCVLSDHATVKVDALELEMSVGGRYTTVEGLVRAAGTALTQSGIVTGSPPWSHVTR